MLKTADHAARTRHPIPGITYNAPWRTFVNVDGLTPTAVPPVYPGTYGEDARYLEAWRRHRRYLDRKATFGETEET